MANNLVKWSALGTFTTLIAGASSSPTLKNLLSGSCKIGDEVDPTGSGARNLFCDLDLKVRFSSSPAAGSYVEVYFVKAVDGTNYEDGSDSVTPAATSLVVRIPVRAVDTQQRISISRIQLPSVKFKPLVKNTTNQGFTNTDDENILSYRPYTEDIVTP